MKEVQRIKEAKEQTEKTARRYREQRDELRAQASGLQAELDGSRAHVGSISGQLQETKRDRQQLQLQLNALRREHEQTLALLDVRTAELRDAQLYLTNTDSVSDAEVLALVEQLNAQIFQAAAQIATIDFDRVVQHPVQQVTEGAKERVTALVGGKLVELLQYVRHQDDPFCLQIALQASMVELVRSFAAAWTFKAEVCDPCMLVASGVWTYLFLPKSQTVSGRWRTLARHYVRTVLPEDNEVAGDLSRYLIRYIADVFAVSGLHFEGAEDALHASISTNHGDRVKTLVESCLKLRHMIGEEMISGDFEVFVVAPGEKFDEPHAKDDCADPRAGKPSAMDHHILCTTAMGLQKIVQVGRTGSERALHTTTLLKANVALETLGSELCHSSINE
ncbi:hypothetical protein WOLCODRAFT_109047 [Wolfiporia cocos MD-104 SS10]|uniref:Uncharacterized protein n=1 Tax=Wolfiporia cocos (strain MD-104) TaxID=742152 RepID=A0A2H3J365_WOLCO|nr:hypothetical protein WOLCODRAFT_109047 [Wolfiporia cocos MD-104 SS10]